VKHFNYERIDFHLVWIRDLDPANPRAARSIVAFAAGHPAPVVGPAAPAVLKVSDVTAVAISPREVAAAPVVRTAIHILVIS
jgi:hypothetical protein